jgi:hypothetical protein
MVFRLEDFDDFLDCARDCQYVFFMKQQVREGVKISSSATGDESALNRRMLRSASVAVRFKDGTAGVRATLVKHPFTLRKEILIGKERL